MPRILCENHDVQPVALVSIAVEQMIADDVSTGELVEFTYFNEFFEQDETIMCLREEKLPLPKDEEGMAGVMVCIKCFLDWIENHNIAVVK